MTLGEQLRAQRERKGITLEQAAADTRIREKFLKALEDGDQQSLPGPVYTRGFLRNYAEYLDLETDELVMLYQHERGAPEPPPSKRTFKPYRPVVHRSLIFRPVIFLPVIVITGVGLFLGYLYYQFTTFATLPRLDIVDPAADMISANQEMVVRGVTVPDGRIIVSVFPGPDTFETRPSADGYFAAAVSLKPGANHVVVEVLDAAGKTNHVSRNIQYQAPASPLTQPPILAVDQPANGATFTNVFVPVSGRVDRSVTRVLVNNLPVSVNPDGSFQAQYPMTAGPQSFRIVAFNSAGGTVEDTRNVVVAYTAAVVNIFVNGGDAWILATVDGNCDPCQGRIYHPGETARFAGKEVRIRSGNAAATQVIYNGQLIANLGRQGEVVERVFTVQ